MMNLSLLLPLSYDLPKFLTIHDLSSDQQHALLWFVAFFEYIC